MNLGDDFLTLARYLVRHEPRRPRQATLRRAISTTYYALFHLLTNSASHLHVSGEKMVALRKSTQRAYDHGAMKQACRAFYGGNLPSQIAPLLSGPIPPDLRLVAETFIVLQDVRHEADYDTNRFFTRSEAIKWLVRAEQAFAAFERIRTTPKAKVFLVSLLLWKQWNRS